MNENKDLVAPKTLSLVDFSPKKEELALLIKQAKELTIKDIDDKAGYDLVHSARMKFVKTRGEISTSGKSLRQEALKFQKKVIILERELIAMIEPVENELKSKERVIDKEKEQMKHIKALPERINRLKEIGVSVDSDLLLTMDDKRFESYFASYKEKYLANKEKEIKEAQDKIEAEKRKLEESKKIEEAKKEAEKKAKEDAIRDAKLAEIKAEEEKKAAIEEEKRKAAEAIVAEKLRAEQEKEKLIAEQKEKERQRLEKERLAKEKAEEEKRKAKEEADKLAKKKKYKDFLKKHDYKEGLEFHIIQTGNKTILYKKVGELTI